MKFLEALNHFLEALEARVLYVMHVMHGFISIFYIDIMHKDWLRDLEDVQRDLEHVQRDNFYK